MGSTVEFVPTEDDRRIIASVMHDDERPEDVIRRALRLLEREARLDRVRRESERLAAETPAPEADNW